MTEPIILIKANPLLPAEDYVALRRQGFAAIEKLGSAIWTDYNNSDPGVTILEALCYALTDLAYRTGFAVKDLLTPEHLSGDTWRQVFYTARQILHNGPLTITDYRKLIVDVTGVRNAWIEPSKDYEVPIWIDYNFWGLREIGECCCTDQPLQPCRGKLQLTPFPTFSHQAAEAMLKKVTLESDERLDALNKHKERLRLLADQHDRASDAYLRINAQITQIDAQIDALRTATRKTLAEIETARTEKKAPPWPLKIVELEGLYNVTVEYEENVIDEGEREEVRKRVLARLSSHRNLCEDFLSVDGVEYVDVGIGASIELEEYADPDDVLAEIFFTLYKYFTPSIPFRTIDEMLARGYLVDEIFEGPALTHGFVDSVDLEKTDLFRDIRLSDIISDVADIEGIKGILYLHLPFEGFGQGTWDVSYFQQWIDELRNARKVARVQPEKSQVIFCKQRELVTYYVGRPEDRRPERMLKLFRDRKALERKYKLHGHKTDYPVPVGEYAALEDYYPVTYSLPLCYGVSERTGLPGEAGSRRQTQALQLKGYLLFFEQILAGYLAQLGHVRDLFTFDASVKHTYFNRVLGDLHELGRLILDTQGGAAHSWEAVKSNFGKALQELTEWPGLFARRRNRFLDHMLARFGEDLGEYERVSRWLTPDKVEARLIEDKIDILKDGHYWPISTNRSRGYDYSQSRLWDTDNVSGTELRVGRLLGLRDVRRRSLVPACLTSKPVMVTDPLTRTQTQKKNPRGQLLNVITLTDPENESDVLLTSVEVPDGCCTDELMSAIIDAAARPANFRSRQAHRPHGRPQRDSREAFLFDLFDGPDFDSATLLATSPYFESASMRERALHAVRAAIDAIHANEGFHLVEHLLLRPRFDEVFDEAGKPIEVSLLDVCLDPCGVGIGLGEGTEVPPYRKRIDRIPARLCYDKMPWVLKYVRADVAPRPDEDSLLFQAVPIDGSDPLPLKFSRYEALQRRVRDLQEFGSERASYEIVSNEKDDPAAVRYGFIIHGDRRTVLAQSRFEFKKKGPVPDNPPPANPDDYVEAAIETWMRFFGYELDLYCEANPCDNDEDLYSFRATAVLPCWPGRFRDETFRNLVEQTIRSESPAHVQIRIVWVAISEMQRFEQAYYDWLQAMLPSQVPSYESVNPLVDVLKTLHPCCPCEDECH
jgi:hypothetical protein